MEGVMTIVFMLARSCKSKFLPLVRLALVLSQIAFHFLQFSLTACTPSFLGADVRYQPSRSGGKCVCDEHLRLPTIIS